MNGEAAPFKCVSETYKRCAYSSTTISGKQVMKPLRLFVSATQRQIFIAADMMQKPELVKSMMEHVYLYLLRVLNEEF